MKVKEILTILLFALILISRPSFATINNNRWSPLIFPLTGLFLGYVASLIISDDDSNNTPPDTPIEPITTNSVHFDQPDVTKNLILTNPNDKALTVDNVSLEGVYGVSVDTSSCQEIPAGGICQIPLTSSTESYGNGSALILFNDSKNTTSSSNISVASISLELYKCTARNQAKTECTNWVTWEPSSDPNKKIILEAEKSPQFYKYTNTSSFYWQKEGAKYVNWRPGFEFPSAAEVNLEDNYGTGSKCGEDKIEPGESCIFTFTDNDDQDRPGDAGEIEALGKNIEIIGRAVLGRGGLEIVESLVPKNLHLGYKALEVVNTVKGKTVTLNNFSASVEIEGSAPPYPIEHCEIGTADCTYITECKGDGSTVLNDGESCLVWFKAKPYDYLWSYNDPTPITIEVTAGGTYDDGGTTKPVDTETDKFEVAYEQLLYAGGDLDIPIAGGGNNHIGKWNGQTSQWSLLSVGTNNGVNGHVRALYYDDVSGDLYVGGDFTQAGGIAAKHVAKWIGSTWLPLGGTHPSDPNNGLNNDVYALTKIDNDLYVGGEFTQTSEATPTPAKKIAKWSETAEEWSSLGTPPNDGVSGSGAVVKALTSIKSDAGSPFNENNLYVGGKFSTAGTVSGVGNIARWGNVDTTPSWSKLSSGLNNEVRALTGIHSEYCPPRGERLYVGGLFTHTATTGTPLDGIALWGCVSSPTPTWFSIGLLTGPGGFPPMPFAYALTKLNNTFYVGGFFIEAGLAQPRIIVNNIAQFQQGLGFSIPTWAPLAGGMPGYEVNAFATLGNDLYVGGSTPTPNNSNSKIASWRDTHTSPYWQNEVSGLSGKIHALATAPSIVITTHITKDP